MTVIAFRPRPRSTSSGHRADAPVPVTGRFRSPRGRTGRLEGTLRLRRLVIVPRGAFVTGVVTGELLDADGSLVGVDSRRVTLPVDLVRQGDRFVPVVRASRLDLIGLAVDLDPAVLDVPLALPRQSGGRRDPARPPAPVDVGPA